MTDEELTAYFEHAKLPETLRLDRACTQFNVQEVVKRNLASLLNDPKDHRCRHRLQRIANAIEKPYDGPEIPRF
jgi:predicted component of type VI protein secretion system